MSEPTCTAHLETPIPATTRASYLCPCGHREDQSWCSGCTSLAAPAQLGDLDVYTVRDMTCPGCGEAVALVAVTPLVYTDQFGPNTSEVARFVTALEAMPRELLERAEAALMPDCCESPEWATVATRADEIDLHDVEFVGAIEAAWAHAARHPQFEHWDHVWDAGASHTAASLVVRGQIHPDAFNAFTAPFIAAGVIPAEPPAGVCAQLDGTGKTATLLRTLEARAGWMPLDGEPGTFFYTDPRRETDDEPE